MFVSYAWAYRFLKLIAALVAWEAKRLAAGATTPTFFWLDLFTNSQHGTAARPFEWWRDTFSSSVSAIVHTLLVLEWEDPVPLRRAWCLLEITASLKDRQPPTMLEVVMAPEEVGAFERALVREFDTLLVRNCAVHAERAEASNAEDRERIFQALRETLGFEEVNKKVIGRMREWMAEAGKAALGGLGGDERGDSSLISHLARLLFAQRKLDEAEPLYTEVLTVRRRTLGDEHPHTLISITNMGQLLHDQGKVGEAEPLFCEVLTGSRRTLGDEHRHTLISITNMALLLQDQGKLGEAEPLYREALTVRRRTLGDDHPETTGSMIELADCLHLQGRLDEALPLAQTSHSSRIIKLGTDHPRTLNSTHTLAILLRLIGAPGRSAQLALHVVACRAATLPPTDKKLLASRLTLALAEGDAAAAQALIAAGASETAQRIKKTSFQILGYTTFFPPRPIFSARGGSPRRPFPGGPLPRHT